MPTYLQTDDNPFMRSLIHEWSTRDDVVSIASPVFTETDLGYRAQYLRPHHAATIIDSRLGEIVPSRWTVVDFSDDKMREFIRAYFLQEYDWFTFFHKDYFLDDMISGSSTFCSSLLVNAVLAVGCVTPPATMNLILANKLLAMSKQYIRARRVLEPQQSWIQIPRRSEKAMDS